MSIVGCLLVAEGSPLSVDCSIVVVDVGVVCCSVSSVLLVVEPVVVVWRVVFRVGETLHGVLTSTAGAIIHKHIESLTGSASSSS